jgi:hypothetical protein
MLYPAELLAHELTSSGERGIRTLGKFPYTRLAGEHLRPLGQLSTHAYSVFNGGGGIRTPGACTLRFSRPPPSATRPLLQTASFTASSGDRERYIHNDLMRVKIRSAVGGISLRDYGPTMGGLQPRPRRWRCWARRMRRRIRRSIRGMAMSSLASCWAVMINRTA